jgi:phosphoglycolate phosphatase-like HAD superfamily hydrolase
VLLQIAQVATLVHDVVSSKQVQAPKPAPDVVAEALGELGLSPNEALLLGDSKHDVEAGDGAGVGVIAVRCGGSSDAELAGALAIYASPADLLAHYDTSPLAVPDSSCVQSS